jgi:hypothetical protein
MVRLKVYRAGETRSGRGGDISPQTEYRVHRTQYSSDMETVGEDHDGDVMEGIDGEVEGVRGGEDEIRRRRGFWPTNRIPSVPHSVSVRCGNDYYGSLWRQIGCHGRGGGGGGMPGARDHAGVGFAPPNRKPSPTHLVSVGGS